jgi:serine protease inhibitor
MKTSKPQLRINHPFFYIIRHNIKGQIVFAGRIVDPTKI